MKTLQNYTEIESPYPISINYIGVIVRNGVIDDVMLYNSESECIDNFNDVVFKNFNPETDDARVFEHVDLSNGDQELTEVYNYNNA